MTNLLYTFHPLANEQQTDIWVYTYDMWGSEQADKYIDGLHCQLIKASKNLSLLRKIPHKIGLDVLFFHYGRHYVFVRRADRNATEKIQVLSILHDGMDIPARLVEILENM